jgi:transcriptional regulator with XRE-family HTH domain
MEKDENIVKKVCKELNVNQRELGEMLDVPAGTISRWASTDDIPKMAKLALELLLENDQYKKGTNALKTAFKLLNLQ